MLDKPAGQKYVCRSLQASGSIHSSWHKRKPTFKKDASTVAVHAANHVDIAHHCVQRTSRLDADPPAV